MTGIRSFLVCAIVMAALALTSSPAPAAQSLMGYSGLLLTPTTEIPAQREFSLGAYFFAVDGADDFAVFAGETGVIPDLEVGLAVLVPNNEDSEWEVNGKYRLLTETESRPSLAVGVFGLGSGNESTLYVVAGKALGPTGTAGVAPAAAFLGVGGGSLDGLFGGVSLPLADNLVLLAEYDSVDFNFGARLAVGTQLRLHGGIFGDDAVGFGVSYYGLF